MWRTVRNDNEVSIVLDKSFHIYKVQYMRKSKQFYVRIESKSSNACGKIIPCQGFTDGRKIVYQDVYKVYGALAAKELIHA